MVHRHYVKTYVKSLTPAEAAARTNKLAEARVRALQARGAKPAREPHHTKDHPAK